eukprot:SAG22_NODE_7637_length_721_cov_1.184887_2_plen_120_part_01
MTAKLAKFRDQLAELGAVELDDIKTLSEADWGDGVPGAKGPFDAEGAVGWKLPEIRRLRRELAKRPEYAGKYDAHLRHKLPAAPDVAGYPRTRGNARAAAAALRPGAAISGSAVTAAAVG